MEEDQTTKILDELLIETKPKQWLRQELQINEVHLQVQEEDVQEEVLVRLLDQKVDVVKVEEEQEVELKVDQLVEEQVVKVEPQGEEQELIEVDQEEGVISGANLISHY